MVSELLSSNERGRGIDTSIPLTTYTEIFNEKFPFYLSIGMTYEQFWERDCTLVTAYRRAYEISRDRKNQELWLQGAYIYDAIARLTPILHAFAKKGAKPEPYPNEPYSIFAKQAELRDKEKERADYEKGKNRKIGRAHV